MGKPNTEWAKGKHCTHCGFYKSDGYNKTRSRIGECTRFNIDVIDCLCGCRKREDGGIVIMNFGKDALDKARASVESYEVSGNM